MLHEPYQPQANEGAELPSTGDGRTTKEEEEELQEEESCEEPENKREAELGAGDAGEEGGLGSNYAPEHLLCPVSLVLMTDPVLAPDGHTYQREALQQCIDYASAREWIVMCVVVTDDQTCCRLYNNCTHVDAGSASRSSRIAYEDQSCTCAYAGGKVLLAPMTGLPMAAIMTPNVMARALVLEYISSRRKGRGHGC